MVAQIARLQIKGSADDEKTRPAHLDSGFRRGLCHSRRDDFRSDGPDPASSLAVVRAMSTEMFLNFLGIRMNPRRAEGG